MLEAFGIEVVFNAGTPLENHALRGIDLTIAEAEFVTVIGTNGAGKSTLLGALAGDIRPRAGSIRIDGEDVTESDAARRARLVGRVFQDPRAGTCEGLTILENLAIAAARNRRRSLRGATARRDYEHYRERLRELGLGLENRINDRVGLLSGGQRQALSLLMACLVPNKVLLLDEHTAALDPHAAANVLELTDQLAARNRLTVLMVTHSMSQALAHGTRTVMLHEGRVLFDLPQDRKRSMTSSDLLDLFKQARGVPVDDDAMVLG
ncbi:ABC transporter ATP-binding protein [Rhodoligotrophos defluvii]|uniref:ABC transporter ATP-binding protein n=1 Tax=Rhodoligotrophos defluvii TaxID=2561934 RepID=UPI0010C99EFF|nr:ATP-binding cassette domain-containing protein [Rhodoligotrophos defluvii]